MVASEMAALLLLLIALLLRGSFVHSQAGLQIGFYDSYCPDAEDIVRSTVEQYYDKDATIAPGLLRLHFHDCFVQVSYIPIFYEEQEIILSQGY
jgi:peroxidase